MPWDPRLHSEVIWQLRRLNEEKGFAVTIMMDTKGDEIHKGRPNPTKGRPDSDLASSMAMR